MITYVCLGAALTLDGAPVSRWGILEYQGAGTALWTLNLGHGLAFTCNGLIAFLPDRSLPFLKTFDPIRVLPDDSFTLTLRF